jgi:hypothetical protein
MRLKHLLVALVAAGLAGAIAAPRAHAQHFVDGFLAQCTAMTSTTCTESTATNYVRQQVQFQLPVNGVSASANAFNFGPYGIGTMAGHAVYTALTGGTIVVLLPFSAPITYSGGILDRGEPGRLAVTYSALTGYYDAGFYAGTYTNQGGTATAGQALTIDRGFLKPPN